MPVVASALAVVSMVELVRPAGRLFLVPATEPPPLVRPWHSLQVTTLATGPWNLSDLLHALPDDFASTAWQTTQSFPVTQLARRFIHCAKLVVVLPYVSVYANQYLLYTPDT